MPDTTMTAGTAPAEHPIALALKLCDRLDEITARIIAMCDALLTDKGVGR